MWVSKLFKKVYFDETPLSEKDYHRSRIFFIVEGATARTIFALTSGAFLAGFAKYLGASDQFNGTIGAIPVFAGIIQIFTPMVFERLEKRKFLISILSFLHRILLGFMVFIPLIIKDVVLCLGLIAGTYFVSYLMVSFISPPASNLIVSLTPESTRGRYFGVRESYILAAVTVVTLVMGRVMDVFKQRGSEYSGFLVVFIFVLVLALINFYFLSAVKEPPVKRNSIPLDIKSIITVPLKDKKFRKIIVMFLLWNIGLQVGGPFFAVYMVTGLKLDYTYIMAMGLLGALTNFTVVRIWGKIADKRSWVFTTKMSITILAATHFLWLFVDPQTAVVLVPLLHIMGGASWAGINISVFNIQFSFCPEDGRTVYLGFNAALGGLVGFASTLIGSGLLGILGTGKLDILGIGVGNMQVIFAISGIILGACAGYVHYYIGKGPSEAQGPAFQSSSISKQV